MYEELGINNTKNSTKKTLKKTLNHLQEFLEKNVTRKKFEKLFEKNSRQKKTCFFDFLFFHRIFFPEFFVFFAQLLSIIIIHKYNSIYEELAI